MYVKFQSIASVLSYSYKNGDVKKTVGPSKVKLWTVLGHGECEWPLHVYTCKYLLKVS